MSNEPAQLSESMYPEVEALVERATSEDVAERFADLRSSLDGLKGPRAEQAKKVRKALDRAEELFLHLLQVRQNLAPTSSSSRK